MQLKLQCYVDKRSGHRAQKNNVTIGSRQCGQETGDQLVASGTTAFISGPWRNCDYNSPLSSGVARGWVVPSGSRSHSLPRTRWLFHVVFLSWRYRPKCDPRVYRWTCPWLCVQPLVINRCPSASVSPPVKPEVSTHFYCLKDPAWTC